MPGVRSASKDRARKAVARAKAKAKAAAAPDVAPAFRIHRRKVGLTYSCPVDADDNPISSCEAIKDALVEKFGPAMWTVSKELHENGKTHFHANFDFDKKLDVTDPRAFDLEGVHPNILTPGKGWENYVRKAGEYITNRSQDDFKVALECETPEEALEYLWQHRPADMLKQGHLIEQNLRRRMHKKTLYQPYYGPYQDWIDWDHEKYSLLLYGPPGGQKTSYARWLMAHKFGDYLFVKKNHESLKEISLWKPFLFDEVYLLEKEPALSREITDVENGGSLSCRNRDGEIPPGIPRVFTSNYEHPFRNPQEAVYGRRVVSIPYDHGVPQSLRPPPGLDPERPRSRSRSRDSRETLRLRSDAAQTYDPTGVLDGIV